MPQKTNRTGLRATNLINNIRQAIDLGDSNIVQNNLDELEGIINNSVIIEKITECK